MNIYKKLQQVKTQLHSIEIKESGNNKFAGYTYMELADFLPHVTRLCNDAGLCTVISFGAIATLTIINSDAPEEQVVFQSPISSAELKGCHAVQNMGAVQTYTKRYLFTHAFDISEHDALDSTHGKDDKVAGSKKTDTPPVLKKEHTEALQNAADFNALLEAWKAIPTAERAAYEAIKDARKAELQGGAK